MIIFDRVKVGSGQLLGNAEGIGTLNRDLAIISTGIG